MMTNGIINAVPTPSYAGIASLPWSKSLIFNERINCQLKTGVKTRRSGDNRIAECAAAFSADFNLPD
jgi:hypothetical protein